MNIELRLLPAEPSCAEPPTAWFLPGADAAAWLAELTAWNAPQAELRLFPLATAGSRERRLGVLVAAPVGSAPRVSPRCQPFVRRGARLYLPAAARLNPEPTPAELETLLPSEEAIYVWHPAAGCVGFAASDEWRIADLVATAEESPANWDLARAGVVMRPRLTSIEPSQSFTPESLFEETRGDIGRDAGGIGQLPRSPDEPAPGLLNQVGRTLARGAARAAEFLTRTPGGSAESGSQQAASRQSGSANERAPSWVGALRRWAERVLESQSRALAHARHRELSRLLRMLRENPDEGLRYALPLTDGGGLSRGVASPSSRLGRRDVDFNLGRLGGGGPADSWDAAEAFQRDLREQYRRLAAREIALGRHRRAAYIFAELLGDLRSAAQTLEDGGHWTEAATLYEHRLRQPRDAARCFARGGLWTEAVRLLETLAAYEEIGDLHTRLEDFPRAEAAYREALARLLAVGNRLAAADLLEKKIQDEDEAFRVLWAGWPDSPQANECLRRAFALLARQARHAQTQRLIGDLSAANRSPAAQRYLIDALAQWAVDYPDAETRRVAAERTRTLVAELLELDRRGEEIERLAQAVARVAPGDRLATRDAERFARQRREANQPRRPAPGRRQSSLVREFSLPSVAWRAAVGSGDLFYAGGWRGGRLFLLRGRLSGVWQAAEEMLPGSPVQGGVLLVPPDEPGGRLLAHAVECPPFQIATTFPASDALGPRTEIGAHRSFAQATVASAGSLREGLGAVELCATHLNVSHFQGVPLRLIGCRAVPLDTLPAQYPPTFPLPCAAYDGGIFLGWGECLIRVPYSSGDPQIIRCDRRVSGIVPLAGGDWVAILQEGGGHLLAGPGILDLVSPLADDLGDAVAAVVGRRRLVIACQEETQVYLLRDDRLRFETRLDASGLPPLAVLPDAEQGQVGILTADGKMRIHQLPVS